MDYYCTSRLLLRQHLAKPNLLPGRLIRQASALPLPPVTTWWARGRRPARSAALLPVRDNVSEEKSCGALPLGAGCQHSSSAHQTMDRAVNGPCRPTERPTDWSRDRGMAWPSLAGAWIEMDRSIDPPVINRRCARVRPIELGMPPVMRQQPAGQVASPSGGFDTLFQGTSRGGKKASGFHQVSAWVGWLRSCLLAGSASDDLSVHLDGSGSWDGCQQASLACQWTRTRPARSTC